MTSSSLKITKKLTVVLFGNKSGVAPQGMNICLCEEKKSHAVIGIIQFYQEIRGDIHISREKIFSLQLVSIVFTR